ncbi:MAG: hypothetical protein AB8H12_01745, partial [Lewinella sp.]
MLRISLRPGLRRFDPSGIDGEEQVFAPQRSLHLRPRPDDYSCKEAAGLPLLLFSKSDSICTSIFLS